MLYVCLIFSLIQGNGVAPHSHHVWPGGLGSANSEYTLQRQFLAAQKQVHPALPSSLCHQPFPSIPTLYPVCPGGRQRHGDGPSRKVYLYGLAVNHLCLWASHGLHLGVRL